jgi:hypothetical protein
MFGICLVTGGDLDRQGFGLGSAQDAFLLSHVIWFWMQARYTIPFSMITSLSYRHYLQLKVRECCVQTVITLVSV